MSSTNFSRNGLTDWFIQRLSAVVLLAFVLCVLGFYLYSAPLDYAAWRDYFASIWMRVFSFIALLALVGHLWVGMWTIITDYIKPVALRLLFQALPLLFSLGLIFWVGLILLGL